MTGIYIHIPFCVQKCKYCDFVSGCFDDNVKQLYFDALKNEIMHYCEKEKPEVDSVFFGGGTPSCVNPSFIQEIMSVISGNMNLSDNAEISIEVNPGTVDDEKCHVYRSAGINRISIGLQSHDDVILNKLGRVHNRYEYDRTVEMVHHAGFFNINTDIMYSLPGQDIESAVYSAEYAVRAGSRHISAYALKYEKGTMLYDELDRGSVIPVDEETDRRMYYSIRELLNSYGFSQYEISNFSKDGFACRHNIKYWDCSDYRGFGAAAHSKIGNVRYRNTHDVSDYISCNGIKYDVEAVLDENAAEWEYVMLGFRLTRGISTEAYRRRFGMEFSDRYGYSFNRLVCGGFLVCGSGMIRLTEKGMDVMNAVLTELDYSRNPDVLQV